MARALITTRSQGLRKAERALRVEPRARHTLEIRGQPISRSEAERERERDKKLESH